MSSISQWLAYYPLKDNANDETGNNNPDYTGSNIIFNGSYAEEWGSYDSYFKFNEIVGSTFDRQTYSFAFAIRRLSGNYTYIISSSHTEGSGELTQYYRNIRVIYSDDKIQFSIHDDNEVEHTLEASGTVQNEWSFCVIIKTPEKMKIVLDGVTFELNDAFTKTFLSAPLTFMSEDNTEYTDYANIRYYDYELSDTDIQILNDLSIPSEPSSGSGLLDNDLDPFNDGSLLQSFRFNGNTANEQGTNDFLAGDSPYQYGTNGRLDKYAIWSEQSGYKSIASTNSTGISGYTDCSFSFWVNNDQYQGFMFAFGEIDQRYNVQFKKSASSYDSTVEFSLHKGAEVRNSDTIPANEWSHIVYTYEDATDTNRFYINGTLVWTVTLAMNHNNKIMEGTVYSSYPSSGYTSAYDQISIWTKTLSQSEIDDLYNMEAYTVYGVTCTPDVAEITTTANNVALPVTVDVGSVTITTTVNGIVEQGDSITITPNVFELFMEVFNPKVQEILVVIQDALDMHFDMYSPSVVINTYESIDVIDMTITPLYVKDAIYEVTIYPNHINLLCTPNEVAIAGEHVDIAGYISMGVVSPEVITYTIIGELRRSLDIIQTVGDNTISNSFVVSQSVEQQKQSTIIQRV